MDHLRHYARTVPWLFRLNRPPIASGSVQTRRHNYNDGKTEQVAESDGRARSDVAPSADLFWHLFGVDVNNRESSHAVATNG
jgi:hypothetical protein